MHCGAWIRCSVIFLDWSINRTSYWFINVIYAYLVSINREQIIHICLFVQQFIVSGAFGIAAGLKKTKAMVRKGTEWKKKHNRLYCISWWGSLLIPPYSTTMGLLSDTQNCVLRMRRECRERFPRDRLHRKPLVGDPSMHHGTCVTHVPWCMSGSLTRGGGDNVPGILGACATRNFTYLIRGPCSKW